MSHPNPIFVSDQQVVLAECSRQVTLKNSRDSLKQMMVFDPPTGLQKFMVTPASAKYPMKGPSLKDLQMGRPQNPRGIFKSSSGGLGQEGDGSKRISPNQDGDGRDDDTECSKKLHIGEKKFLPSDTLTIVGKDPGSTLRVTIPASISQPTSELVFRLPNIYATTSSLPNSRRDFMEAIPPWDRT